MAARLIYCVIAYQKHQLEIALRECGPVVAAGELTAASQAILDWAGIGAKFRVGTAAVFVPASRDAAVLMATAILESRGELAAARGVAEELSPSDLSTALRATLAMRAEDLDGVLTLTAVIPTPPQSEIQIVGTEVRVQALRRLGKPQEALDLLFAATDAAREGNDSLRCHHYLEIARTLVARDTPSKAWSWLNMARDVDPGCAELSAVTTEITTWRPTPGR